MTTPVKKDSVLKTAFQTIVAGAYAVAGDNHVAGFVVADNVYNRAAYAADRAASKIKKVFGA